MLLPENHHARRSILRILRERHIPGMVQWRDQPRREMLAIGIMPDQVNDALFGHVNGGGEINETEETNPAYPDFKTYYGFRIMVLAQQIYVKAKINDLSRIHPSFLWVVSAHDGWWE